MKWGVKLPDFVFIELCLQTKNEISNCRPIANLNAASKVFENMILQRIMEIEEDERVDSFIQCLQNQMQKPVPWKWN